MRGTIRRQDVHFRFQDVHFRNAVSLPAVQRSVETATVAAAGTSAGGLLGDVFGDFYGTEGSDVFVGTAKDETIYGNGGNDTLHGGGGNDTMHSEAGTDVIIGGLGQDVMTGGAGAGRFVFTSPAASHGFYDRITDFQRGIDKSDLSASETNPDTGWPYAGDHAFMSIGYKTLSGKHDDIFSHKPGKLPAEIVNNSFTLVQGDINGDGLADFTIRVDGTVPLTANDFIL